MSIGNHIFLYMLLWWVIFFMTLPFGVKIPLHIPAGHATSAPERPWMGWKIGATFVVAALVYGIIWFAIDYFQFSFIDFIKRDNQLPGRQDQRI